MSHQHSNTETATLADLRVARRIAPNRDGAKRFTLRYGEKLVCVRHRLNAAATVRFTTVEILVEQTPVVPAGSRLVTLRLEPRDRASRSLLLACGGHWDQSAKVWLVTRGIAKSLGMLAKIVRV